MTARNQRGFTLVSVLVALAILAIGLLALARAQAAMVASQGNVANRTTALTIARDYAEILRSRDPWTLVSETPVAVDARGQASANGAYRRSTNVTILANNLIRLQILVTYPRSATPVDITTLIYRST
ncbi:MAG TPA: prepilin-type N-terminal cleavage/methylation domain-containing protein [Gemmatimonadales bacterium]|nr:prepilin-type N-terminal cleavage/methylation domain-containing protein [Gemmatimonadales bacterium]